MSPSQVIAWLRTTVEFTNPTRWGGDPEKLIAVPASTLLQIAAVIEQQVNDAYVSQRRETEREAAAKVAAAK